MDLLNGLGQLVGEIAKFDTLKKVAPIFGVIGVLIRVAESVLAWSSKRGVKARRQELTAELRETTSLLEDVKKLDGADAESVATRQLRLTLEQKRVEVTQRLAVLLEAPAIAEAPVRVEAPHQSFWRRLFLAYWPSRPMARVAQVFTWTTVVLGCAAFASASSDGFDSETLFGLVALALFALLLREWALFEEFDVGRLPARTLMKRVTLFYRPTRSLGWIAHVVYWYFWVVVVALPFSLEEDDYADAYVGIPTLLILVWLVHRWARHFDAPKTSAPTGAQNSPKRSVRVGIGLSIAVAIAGATWLAVVRLDSSAADESPSFTPIPQRASSGPPPVRARGAAPPPSGSGAGDAVNAPPRPPADEHPITADTDGAWTLEGSGATFTLRLTDGLGTVDVTRALTIEQAMVVGPPPSNVGGLLVSGAHPVVLGTDFSPGGYTADEILVQRQKDGTLAVWTRDNVNVKEWAPFTIVKLDPARTPAGPDLSPADLDGTWTFADFGSLRRAATMILAGGKGRFVTPANVRIHQRAIARSGKGGVFVAGVAPSLESSSVAAPGYEPDQFVFLPKPEGGFDVMLRIIGADKKPDWAEMKVVKAGRAR